MKSLSSTHNRADKLCAQIMLNFIIKVFLFSYFMRALLIFGCCVWFIFSYQFYSIPHADCCVSRFILPTNEIKEMMCQRAFPCAKLTNNYKYRMHRIALLILTTWYGCCVRVRPYIYIRVLHSMRILAQHQLNMVSMQSMWLCMCVFLCCVCVPVYICMFVCMYVNARKKRACRIVIDDHHTHKTRQNYIVMFIIYIRNRCLSAAIFPEGIKPASEQASELNAMHSVEALHRTSNHIIDMKSNSERQHQKEIDLNVMYGKC